MYLLHILLFHYLAMTFFAYSLHYGFLRIQNTRIQKRIYGMHTIHEEI